MLRTRLAPLSHRVGGAGDEAKLNKIVKYKNIYIAHTPQIFVVMVDNDGCVQEDPMHAC